MLFVIATAFGQAHEGGFGCRDLASLLGIEDEAEDVAYDRPVQFSFGEGDCEGRGWQFDLSAGDTVVYSAEHTVPVGTFLLELPLEPSTAYTLSYAHLPDDAATTVSFTTAAAPEVGPGDAAAGCTTGPAAGWVALAVAAMAAARRRA